MEYTQEQMIPMQVPDPSVVDQTLEMSPMDLFDSIFWGEYSLILPMS
jgi:hypothetical protein